MFDLLCSLLAIAAIVLALFGVGRPLVRRAAIAGDDLFATVVWSLSLGLVAAGWTLSLLAIVGLLFAPLVILLTLCAGFWGIGEMFCDFLAWRAGTVLEAVAAPASKRPQPSVSFGTVRALLILAGCAAAGALVSALAPPDSPEALGRYLELSKSFLLSHGIARLPYSDYDGGPLMLEILYAWGMALDGPVAAGLLAWICGLLLACATVLLARPLLGSRGALAAGAILLLTPGIAYQMGAPLDDLALALFTTLFLAAWWQGVILARQGHWLLVAGAMAGGAIGIKPVGLALIAAVVAVSFLALRHRPASWRPTRRAVAQAALAALAVGGVWYVRALAHGGTICAMEPGRNLLPQCGALLLALVPGLLLVRHAAALKPLLLVAVAYVLVASVCYSPARWWGPLAPMLAVAATFVWREIVPDRGVGRRLVQFGLGLLALVSVAMPLARARDAFAVAVGWQSRQDYLAQHESIYRAVQMANCLLRPGDRLLSQDPRTLYFSCPATDERAYRRRAVEAVALDDGASVSRRLRSDGFTHVLLAEPIARLASETAADAPSDLAERIGRELKATGESTLLPLDEYESRGGEATARRYRLMKLR